MRRTLLRTFSLLVVAALFAAPAAFGQVQPPPQQQQPPDIEVTEAQLDAVADVYVEVAAIQAEYRQQFQAAENPEEANQLQAQMQQEMTQAIEENEEVDVETYDQIIRAAQVDEELRERLIAKIEAKQGGPEDTDGSN